MIQGVQLPQGHYFAALDLQAAQLWAAARPAIRLSLMLDHPYFPEIIRIFVDESNEPRWCIWLDFEGQLHADDWFLSDFNLPCPTVQDALRLIAACLPIAHRHGPAPAAGAAHTRSHYQRRKDTT